MILRSKELDGIDTSDLGDEGNGNDLGESAVLMKYTNASNLP